MGKLLFYILLALLVYQVIKKRSRPLPPQEPRREVEDMVRCARCGVHLPRSEAIMSGGEFYCCDAHRKEGKS